MIKVLCSVVLLLGTTAACGSDDKPNPDAGLATIDAMPSASIGYMEPCNVADDQCADGLLCFGFNMKGPHCTHACSVPSDCEAPSVGCIKMNVCKTP